MDINKYIASGVLELYVSGTLSEKENQEVYGYILKYPEIKKEVEEIEAAIKELTAAMAPRQAVSFEKIHEKTKQSKVIELSKLPRKTNNFAYVGWAASVALTIGMSYMYYQNSLLKDQLAMSDSEKIVLEERIFEAKESANELSKIIRDEDMIGIALGAQKVDPKAYAKVFWNQKNNTLFVDAAGLPEPPEGMEYQVWSLTLDPLTPTSIGLLSDFENDENKIFSFSNPNGSQAFGITLEPEGGSDSPTMEQLYTLGVVGNS